MFISVKCDGDGFITDFKTTDKDGYTKAFLPDRWINDFMKYSGKFRYDDSQLLNPGNLPATTITDLESSVSDLQTTSKQTTAAETTLATGQTSLSTQLSQVQQAVTTLAIQQATATTDTKTTTE